MKMKSRKDQTRFHRENSDDERESDDDVEADEHAEDVHGHEEEADERAQGVHGQRAVADQHLGFAAASGQPPVPGQQR